MSDPQDIVQRIKAGDERAFEYMFKDHYGRMCGYAVKYLSDLDLAEEVVQEVFLNFWEKRIKLNISGSLEGYLFRSVRNACLNHIKHMKVRQQYALSQNDTHQSNDIVDTDTVVELELSQKIDDCIDQMPPERKKIFLLSREDGLKYKEIAEKLDISVKTVEAQMGKALKYLRENLVEYISIIAALACLEFLKLSWIINFFGA